MNTKNLVTLVILAAVLGLAAMFLSDSSRPAPAKLNGKTVLPGLEIGRIAKIEVGDKLALVNGDDGWTIPSMQDYPADPSKVSENLLKLVELKVGQTARGRKLGTAVPVVLKDASGAAIAELKLGDRHQKWGHGRYAEFQGETVLVSDELDAFGDDPKKWVETKIVDEPWISFNRLASLTNEVEYGFATGVVAKVKIGSDTNRVATIGGTVKGGSDRYLKLDNSKWVFEVSSYSVEKLLPKPEPKAEAKAETKTEAKPEVKAEAKPAAKPESKPAAKPAVEIESKPVAKPEVKAEAKPAAKPAEKPAAK